MRIHNRVKQLASTWLEFLALGLEILASHLALKVLLRKASEAS